MKDWMLGSENGVRCIVFKAFTKSVQVLNRSSGFFESALAMSDLSFSSSEERSGGAFKCALMISRKLSDSKGFLPVVIS